MPLSSEDTALIKNLYRFQKYSFQRMQAKLLKINCNRERVGMLLTEIWKRCSTDQRHETGRLNNARTEENVITVDGMVSLLKAQKQTYRTIRQISKETDLTKCSIIQIIHCILVESVFWLPTRLLSITVSFSCIYISQGSVATQLTFDGIFNNHFIANCSQNALVKKLWKSVSIWRRYRPVSYTHLTLPTKRIV